MIQLFLFPVSLNKEIGYPMPSSCNNLDLFGINLPKLPYYLPGLRI
jgi:hypothetical protein